MNSAARPLSEAMEAVRVRPLRTLPFMVRTAFWASRRETKRTKATPLERRETRSLTTVTRATLPKVEKRVWRSELVRE